MAASAPASLASQPAPGTHAAFLGLGSNLGDRRGNVERVLQLLSAAPGVRVVAVSSVIETVPVGGPGGQPAFLNAACGVRTALSPRRLLGLALEIEGNCGRIHGQRWGPRTADVDILLYDELIVSEPDLVIPHPLMHERRFVLAPLAEIAPDVRHPVLKKTVRELLASLGSGDAAFSR